MVRKRLLFTDTNTFFTAEAAMNVNVPAYSVEEATLVLKCSVPTAHRYATDGLPLPNGALLILPSFKLGGRRWFPQEGVRWFVQTILDLQKSKFAENAQTVSETPVSETVVENPQISENTPTYRTC